MNTNIGKSFDLAGQILPVTDVASIPAENGCVYEIIRIIDGKALFFEDHMDRMAGSASAAGLSVTLDKQDILRRIAAITEANGYSICNVKVVAPVNDQGEAMIYVSSFSYPEEALYSRGVDTDFLAIERPNPNAKVMRDTYKQEVADFIDSHGCYEALLVSADGTVTEGSRSNVFFVKGTEIITTPGELVLRGITRRHIIDACGRAGAKVSEQAVSLAEAVRMDGIFISGTSIGVLPVRRAGEHTFKTAELPLVREIRRQYEIIVKENLL